MKKLGILFISIWAVLSPVQKASALCADPVIDEDFINLFNQELADSCDYLPFLRTDGRFYYKYYDDAHAHRKLYSGNVKEWASYLKIGVEQAEHLVMKASKKEIDSLLKNHTCANKELSFADKKFCEKNHEALEYLSYAKYLEPYMCITLSEESLEGYYDFTSFYWEGEWRYRDGRDYTVAALPYEEIMTHLKEKYKSLSDKELKLRYGYQIVRLAHYARRYSEAVEYFDKYVKKLRYRPEMYYYALNQKAGALRGLLFSSGENVSDKDRLSYLNDFLKVFKSSQDMKKSVVNSLKIMDELEFLFQAKDRIDKEGKMSYHFLQGYRYFNDPISEAKEIAKIDPNAIEARVLMARYINDIERSIHDYDNYDYPIFGKKEGPSEYEIDVINWAEKMSQSSQKKTFWNLAVATLLAYSHSYEAARDALSKVEEDNPKVKSIKKTLQLLVDIEEPDVMTREVADTILSKNGFTTNQTPEFLEFDWISKLWGKRFYMSGDSIIGHVMYYYGDDEVYDLDLCNRLIDFVNKEDKNDFEKWVIWVQNLQLNELKFKKAILFLNERRGSDNLVDIASIDSAYHLLKELKNKSEVEWKCAFCNNIRGFNYYDKEEQNDFHYDYIKEILGTLPAEKTPLLTYLEYIKELNKTVQQSPNKNKAAKAAFLLGNFYFNLSDEGYYRGRSIFASSVYDAYSYYLKGFSLAKDKELKARLTFALAKTTHQGIQHYLGEYFHLDYGPYYHVDDVTSDIDYYELLSDMDNTKYYKEVVSKCKYFELYLNN